MRAEDEEEGAEQRNCHVLTVVPIPPVLLGGGRGVQA